MNWDLRLYLEPEHEDLFLEFWMKCIEFHSSKKDMFIKEIYALFFLAYVYNTVNSIFTLFLI